MVFGFTLTVRADSTASSIQIYAAVDKNGRADVTMTVRLRLDRLIEKIRLAETAGEEPYVAQIKRLALDGRLDYETAKLLISEYRKTKE